MRIEDRRTSRPAPGDRAFFMLHSPYSPHIREPMSRLLPLLAVIAPLACGGCAVPQGAGADRQANNRPIACDAELRAFVAVTRLAREQGEEPAVYEAALE